MFEREYRELQFVPRWGIVRVIRRQSVAEHSYYVVIYTLMLADYLGYSGDSLDIIAAAAFHDLEEVFMSDIPGPVKRQVRDGRLYDRFVSKHLSKRFGDYPGDYLKSIGPAAKSIIKVADMIEECMYLSEEYQLGNSNVVDLLKKDLIVLKDMIIGLQYDPKILSSLWVKVHTAITNNMTRPSDLDFTPAVAS